MPTPLLAPPEAQPGGPPGGADFDGVPPPTESLAKPFRLGIAGVGAAVGLFARLAAANGFGELDSRTMMLAMAVTSATIGVGLLLIAGERDRFSAPLVWMTAITALAWGALNWISPPFAASVTVWSKPDQTVLAILGVGNGVLLAGLVTLALVRRAPTLTVAATMIAGVIALASNTILLRDEWPAIVALGAAFGFILLAWDRSPRRERTFVAPQDSPRVSRAALSFIAVALCGTALQLWLSRTTIPRAIPAVALCVLLIVAAFASLIRVRREIERRETTLSEWTSWMREIRTKDFRAEMQNFESEPAGVTFDPRPPVGFDGEAPRPLSFPNLSVADAETPTSPDTDLGRIPIVPGDSAAASGAAPKVALPAAVDLPGIRLPSADSPAEAGEPKLPTADVAATATATPAGETPRRDLPVADGAPQQPATEPEPAAARAPGGAFSAVLATPDPAPRSSVIVADLGALGRWLTSPVAAARQHPLLVAIEAMSLDEFESLPPVDAAMATDEIGSFLADTMPNADLVSWIDGPYFIVAHASRPDRELLELNKTVRKQLKPTDGTLAFLRPGTDASLDDIVNEAVTGLLQARQNQQRLTS